MARKRVQVSRDHVQQLIGTSPQKAIEELIWNALDAGGARVEVKLRLNKMGGVDRVQVIDRGPGILPTELDRAFGNIGNSIKAQQHTNADGRAYHGREGKGRFKALALSPVAVWETAFRENGTIKVYQITLRRDEPDYYDATAPADSRAKNTGTRVILDGLDKGHQSLSRDDVRDKLAEEFAAYLTSYPGVSLVWDGRPIRIEDVIDQRAELDVLSVGDQGGPASMLVIEWKFKPDGKRLHICDENGFSFHDIPAGVQAPGIEYTAYLRTPQTREWNESGRFVVQELDEEVAGVVNAAKERLREYVRARMAEEAVSVVQEWKDQEIYPYGTDEPTDPLAKAEREVFDIVAVRVNEQHSAFEKSDPQNKRLTLALIKQALESNPSSLTKILREVVALPEDEQAAFAELLERTPLTNLIRAGRIVADRLDVIQAFEHILFEKDWKKRLLERTQLHRLLVHELWLLGEEYALGADDEGLRAVLTKHLHILNREDLAPDVDVKLIDGKGGIPDLMLYRRRKVDRDRFDHLIVELKRPSDRLGQEETGQIKKYAFTVAKDERFNTSKCSWQFVLLGNDLDDFVVQETSSAKLPEGCLFEGNGVRIWVHRWADVLNDARARYQFFRDQLKIEASHAKGLETLKARYPHLFEGRGARKRRDLELSAASEP